MNFRGKKIFIAGASSGIGQATAIMISQLGGRVVLCGRSKEKLDLTQSMMEGDGHLSAPYDLTQCDGIKQYIKNCVDADGIPFNGFVFTAGVSWGTVIRAQKLESYRDMMESNYFSYVALLKEFCSRKVLDDGGSIVALSSSITFHWDKSTSAYACSKSALEAISNVASHELVGRKIRVNTVCPEMVNTPMSKTFFQQLSEDDRNVFYPLGSLEPMDVANTIVFLLSDMSSKITGQKIYISAGNDGRPIEYIF